MGWKEHAETLKSELKRKNDVELDLRHQLAELQELSSRGDASMNGKLSQAQAQVTELHALLASKDGEINRLLDVAERQRLDAGKKQQEAGGAASIEKSRVQAKLYTLQKNHAARVQEQSAALKQKTHATLKPVSTTAACDESQQKLLEQLEKKLKDANANNERLMRQLQQEKAANVGKLAFMEGDVDKSKIFGQSDDEELPAPKRVKSEHTSSVTKTLPSTKRQNIIFPPAKKHSASSIYAAPSTTTSSLLTATSNSVRPKAMEKTASAKSGAAPTANTAPHLTPSFFTAKKRKRSKENQLAEELESLKTSDGFIAKPLNSRRGGRARRQQYVTIDDVEEDDMFKHPRDRNCSPTSSKFNFVAVCEYNSDGTRNSFYPSQELAPVVADLWDRINVLLRDIWTARKGDYWQFDFEHNEQKTKHPICVTRRCEGGRATWRKGFEGIFACRSCVEKNRPCFVYVIKEGCLGVKEERGEFLLLPLHKEDRRKEVKKDFETRWWVNDEAMARVDEETDEDEFMDG